MNSPWQTDSLAELETLVWSTLGRAVADAHHPWSLPTVGSQSADGPDLRTLVLRQVDRTWRRLVAFSDSRSPKIPQWRSDPRTAWHFYDHRQRVQLRLRGVSVIEHDNDYARRLWHEVPEANRANYRTMGVPGTTIPTPAEGHIFAPGGDENFAVIVTTVNWMDWLWLAPAAHRRAHFDWQNGAWQGNWTVP